MIRKLFVVAALLSVSLTGGVAKEAEARNEDVPKGPTAAPPPTVAKPQSNSQQAPTGSVKGGEKPSAPSAGGKGAAPGK